MFKTRGWPHTGYVCPLNDIHKDGTSFNILKLVTHDGEAPSGSLEMLPLKGATFFSVF